MIPRDDYNPFAFLRGISPVTQTNSSSALVSQIIDMQSYLSCIFIVAVGTFSDADATSTVLLEEADASDMSGANAVADADMLPSGTGQEASTAFIFSDDNIVRALGYVGTKRYIRLTITPANNDSGSLPISVTVLARKRFQGTGN